MREEICDSWRWFVTIREGSVTNQQRMSWEQFRAFRELQFRAYQQTEEYKSDFERLKDPDETSDEVEDFIFKVSVGRYMSMIFDARP